MSLDPRIMPRIRQASGLDMAASLVERAVRQRMALLTGVDEHGYAERLLSNAQELENLIDLIVVPETWFFRDPHAFEYAAQASVALRRTRGRRVRLLSLPCATGEEPYSLTMALLDAGLAASDFTIDALDISPPNLIKARRAEYGRNAFRAQDLGFRARYFDAHEERHLLQERVRTQVAFAQGNILQLSAAERGGLYDIVFCRNLLIYFDEQTQRQAIINLAGVLADDGLLFTGSSEMSACSRHGFANTGVPRTSSLRKSGQGAAVARGRVPTVRQAPHPPSAVAPRATAEAPRRRAAPVLKPAPVTAPVPIPATSAVKVPATPAVALSALLDEARRLADSGRLDQAEACLQRYIGHDPHSAQAFFLLGLLQEQRDPQEAGKQLRRAIYLDPAHYEALCHLAVLAERNGDDADSARLRARASRVLQRQDGR